MTALSDKYRCEHWVGVGSEARLRAQYAVQAQNSERALAAQEVLKEALWRQTQHGPGTIYDDPYLWTIHTNMTATNLRWMDVTIGVLEAEKKLRDAQERLRQAEEGSAN